MQKHPILHNNITNRNTNCYLIFSNRLRHAHHTSTGNESKRRRTKTTTTTKSTEESPDTSSIVVTLMKETSDRALEMLPDTLLRHWTLWPIVHTWNFYYNPIHHRVLVQNIVLIFWSGYLSHLNNGGLEIVTPEKEIDMVAAEHEQQRRETKNKTSTTTTKTATDKSGMQLATSGRTH
mmetsp:Transcript_7660/g.15880  ORF Transcript_7660/g.15880 Transcript_7660/m.15880 type:complete len:178 (-) Transcript_7660:1006-1539(-)